MTNPPPAATAAVPASIGRRVGAYAIDVAVAFGIALVLVGVCAAIIFAVGPAWTERTLAVTILFMYLGLGLASLVWALVYTAMQGGRGSIGQRLVGIALADAVTAGPIGFWRALLRNIVFSLAGSIVVGYFSPLFDSSGRYQGWHDKAASALVVDRAATDALAAAAAPAPPARVPNPYLPPPAGAPVTPAGGFGAPAQTPAFSAPATPSFAAPTGPVVTGAAVASAPAYAGAASIPPRPPLPAAHAAPAVAVPATGMIAHVPGITEDRPAEASVSPVVDDDLDATRAAPSAPATARPALDPDARAIAVLTWDDGGRMAVYGRTLFGRNPAAEEDAVSVAVRDETLSLSKTHFEIGCDDSGAWIVDRHSTNGTVLVRDGMRHPLLPGTPTSLRAGDRLEFGDRSATVSEP